MLPRVTKCAIGTWNIQKVFYPMISSWIIGFLFPASVTRYDAWLDHQQSEAAAVCYVPDWVLGSGFAMSQIAAF